MKKRFLAIFAAVLMLAALLSACGGPDGSGSAAPSGSQAQTEDSSAPAAGGGQNITVAHVQGEWMWGILDELAANYNAESGNTIEWLYVPADGINDWVTTQFVGGTAPDIIWASSMPVGDYYKNGWTIDLKAAYEAESPYTGKPWQDSYYPGILEGVLDTNGSGAWVGVPLSIVTVNLYYNTDIMAEMEIDGSSLLSWSDVMDAAQTVKDSGKDYVPFAIQNSIRWNLGWLENFAMESLWYDIVPEVDIMDPNGVMELNEQILAVKAGIMDPADSRMVDYFRFMKEFATLFNNGFNAASWEYEALFNEGKAAMTINGSWFPNQVVMNELDVNYGVGPMPYVDAAISDKSENRLRQYSTGRGGPDLFVTSKAADEGRSDAAIDFLRYLSDPATGAKFITEECMWIPVVEGVDVPAEMEGLTQFIGEDLQNVGYKLNAITPEQQSRYDVMFADFLVNDQSPEDFAQAFKALVDEACDEAIAEHPEWNFESYLAQLQG